MKRRDFLGRLPAAAVLALPGCQRPPAPDGLTPRAAPALEAGLLALQQHGGTQALSALTEAPWDEVIVFHEGAALADIQARIGQPLAGGTGHFDAARYLLVFRRQGRPMQALLLNVELFASDALGHWHGRDVLARVSAPGERVVLHSP